MVIITGVCGDSIMGRLGGVYVVSIRDNLGTVYVVSRARIAQSV